nr:DUF6290 family protein [Exiguobacterium sp. s192]
MHDQDIRLIKEYVKAKNITISASVRDAVNESIEKDIDLILLSKKRGIYR